MADMSEVASSKIDKNPRLVYLVEEQPNPSTDYFILPAFSSSRLTVVHCGFDDVPAKEKMEGALVILVRYVPSAWKRLIDEVRPRLHSLIFFMDDDVLDSNATNGLPLRYRYKLARLATWQSYWLRKQGVELWVSNAYLQEKYALWSPALVLPSPGFPEQSFCRVFYHGSASHDAEIRWLRPVIEKVLGSDARISFEIIGGVDVNRSFRTLPRVNVIHPMKWPSYIAFNSLGERQIGLAPLLDTVFNKARSYTKYFDITRCGAVGIYSPYGAYSKVVSHGQNGLIVEMDKGAWVEAILELAGDESLRHSMLLNAVKKSEELTIGAQSGYSALLK